MYSVVIPTHDHQDTILFSIKSVLNQTIQNFEILIIGDGSPLRTQEILSELISTDERIKYIPHSKGDGHGESYRHEAILNSNGSYIFYLCDDDMWLPNHIELVAPFLTTFDFVHSIHSAIMPEKGVYFLEDQIMNVSTRQKMTDNNYNFFGPTCVAHTKEAYLKLPFGWRPRPEGVWSDLYMWRQWFEQENMSFFSIPIASTIHFPSPQRLDFTLNDRLNELNVFWNKVLNENYYSELNLLRNQRINSIDLSLINIKGLLQSTSTLNSTLTAKNQSLIDVTTTCALLMKNHSELKSALSTRLGFFLTKPIRKIYDYFK